MHFVLAPVLVTCAQAAAPFQALGPDGLATIDIATAEVTWHFNAHAQDAHAWVD